MRCDHATRCSAPRLLPDFDRRQCSAVRDRHDQRAHLRRPRGDADAAASGRRRHEASRALQARILGAGRVQRPAVGQARGLGDASLHQPDVDRSATDGPLGARGSARTFRPRAAERRATNACHVQSHTACGVGSLSTVGDLARLVVSARLGRVPRPRVSWRNAARRSSPAT